MRILSPGEQTMSAKLIERGRGPDIEGAGIAVYDVCLLPPGRRYDHGRGW